MPPPKPPFVPPPPPTNPGPKPPWTPPPTPTNTHTRRRGRHAVLPPPSHEQLHVVTGEQLLPGESPDKPPPPWLAPTIVPGHNFALPRPEGVTGVVPTLPYWINREMGNRIQATPAMGPPLPFLVQKLSEHKALVFAPEIVARNGLANEAALDLFADLVLHYARFEDPKSSGGGGKDSTSVPVALVLAHVDEDALSRMFMSFQAYQNPPDVPGVKPGPGPAPLEALNPKAWWLSVAIRHTTETADSTYEHLFGTVTGTLYANLLERIALNCSPDLHIMGVDDIRHTPGFAQRLGRIQQSGNNEWRDYGHPEPLAVPPWVDGFRKRDEDFDEYFHRIRMEVNDWFATEERLLTGRTVENATVDELVRYRRNRQEQTEVVLQRKRSAVLNKLLMFVPGIFRTGRKLLVLASPEEAVEKRIDHISSEIDAVGSGLIAPFDDSFSVGVMEQVQALQQTVMSADDVYTVGVLWPGCAEKVLTNSPPLRRRDSVLKEIDHVNQLVEEQVLEPLPAGTTGPRGYGRLTWSLPQPGEFPDPAAQSAEFFSTETDKYDIGMGYDNQLGWDTDEKAHLIRLSDQLAAFRTDLDAFAFDIDTFERDMQVLLNAHDNTHLGQAYDALVYLTRVNETAPVRHPSSLLDGGEHYLQRGKGSTPAVLDREFRISSTFPRLTRPGAVAMIVGEGFDPHAKAYVSSVGWRAAIPCTVEYLSRHLLTLRLPHARELPARHVGAQLDLWLSRPVPPPDMPVNGTTPPPLWFRLRKAFNIQYRDDLGTP